MPIVSKDLRNARRQLDRSLTACSRFCETVVLYLHLKPSGRGKLYAYYMSSTCTQLCSVHKLDSFTVVAKTFVKTEKSSLLFKN